MIYSIPHLRHFISTAGNLWLKTATFIFCDDCLEVKSYPHKGARLYTLNMELGGRHLDRQIVSAEFVGVDQSSRPYTLVQTVLRSLYQCVQSAGLFGKVKPLFVEYGLVKQVSRSTLQPNLSPSRTHQRVHSALHRCDSFRLCWPLAGDGKRYVEWVQCGASSSQGDAMLGVTRWTCTHEY
jgi:hypothetical protein